jgi:hypothetical protein
LKEREELRQQKAAAAITNKFKQFAQTKKDGDANPIFRKLRVLQKMKNVLKLELNNLQDRDEEEEDIKRWEEEERARWVPHREAMAAQQPPMPPSCARPLHNSSHHLHPESPPADSNCHDQAMVLQCMCRKWHARRTLTARAMSTYERLYDPNSGRHYYYNVITDTSSWRKPPSLGSKEPLEVPSLPR